MANVTTPVIQINEGNVGIGVTTPSVTLELNSSESNLATLRIGRSTSHTNYLELGTSGGSSVINAIGIAGVRASTIFRQSNTSDFIESMRITESGRVGIGTSSPSHELQVQNSVNNSDVAISVNNSFDDNLPDSNPNSAILLSATSNNAHLRVHGAPNDEQAKHRVDLGSTAGGSYLTFSPNGSEKVRISEGGRLGVGTTTPDGILDVVQGNSQMLFSGASSDRSYFRIKHNAIPVAGEELSIFDFAGFNSASQDTRYVILTAKAEVATDGSEEGSLNFSTMKAGTATQTLTLRSAKVGIGTADPVGDLEIFSTDTSVLSLSYNGGGGTGSKINFNLKASTVAQPITTQIAAIDDGAYRQNLIFSTKTAASHDSGISERMRLTPDGNLGIGVTTPGAKLGVDGGVRASQGFSNDTDGLKLSYPGGGSNIALGNAGAIGAIKITLPVSWTNTMMRMTIKVYEYTTNESFTLVCGGYNYSGGSAWLAQFAYIESQANLDRNFTVRMGHDGTKCCIYIGELTSSWQYPKVYVTDFEAGFNNVGASTWQDGWDISMETTAFGTLTYTNTNTQVNNWQRSGQDVYYGSGSGNVAIGNSNPSDYSADANNLVVGSLSGNNGITILSTASSGYGSIYFADGATENKVYSGFIRYQHNISDMTFGTNEVERMRLTLEGYLGIGTTNPATILDIESGENSTDPAVADPPILRLTNRTAVASWVNGAINGEIQFYTKDTSGNAPYITGFIKSINENGGSLPSGGLAFGTTKYNESGGASERMRIDTNGNVGIGATSPGAKLDVNGDILIGTTDKIGWRYSSGNTSYQYITGVDQILTLTGGTWTSSATQAAVRMNTQQGQKITLLNNGNLGIGTTSPNTKLELSIDSPNYGDMLTLTNTNIGGGSKRSAMIYRLTDSVGTIKDAAYVQVQGTNNNITGGAAYSIHTRKGDANPTESMRIDSSGNVGIGTSSPDALLEISGNAGADPSPITKPTTFRITDSGNAATGSGDTTNPWGKIEFYSEDVSSSGPAVQAQISTVYSSIYSNASSLDFSTRTTPAATLTTRMRITSAGNVSIGNTNNTYKLDVSGTIRATGDVIAYSDARVKDNVETIENALDKVTQLRGVSYTRNDVEEKTTKIGVIAQEVLEVLPEVVQQDDEGKYSVAYGNMVGLLIESIKELKAEVDELKSRL